MEEKENTLIDFEFGDLYISCDCGHETQIKAAKGIANGLRVELYTTNNSSLSLVCDKCKHKMGLFFKEAEDIFKLKMEKAEREKKLKEAELELIEEARTINEETKEDGNTDSSN